MSCIYLVPMEVSELYLPCSDGGQRVVFTLFRWRLVSCIYLVLIEVSELYLPCSDGG